MIRVLKVVILLLLVLSLGIVGGLMFGAFSSFGSLPTDENFSTYKISAQFDTEKSIFVNRRPTILEEMRKRTMNFSSILKFIFNNTPDRVPKSELPAVTPDFEAFKFASNDIKLIWFGHSSILLSLDGKMILIDPVLSSTTGPFGFMMKRFRATVAEPSTLPAIDVVVISHDHYDHLDTDTIRAFKEKQTKFMVPLGVGAHLRHWGIAAERITEMDWWQSANVDGIQFTATPAQHFSGRSLVNQTKSLWASWVVQSKKHRVYFSGDSGYDVHFKEIGDKLGPFDIAFIENGQYNEKWPEVHLHPADSIQAYFDLRAKKYFPMHWGMFSLAMHAWHEPVERLSEEALKKNIPLITPVIGETVTVNEEYKPIFWWKDLLKQNP